MAPARAPSVASGSVDDIKAYLQVPLSHEIVAGIAGNASSEAKIVTLKWLSIFNAGRDAFALAVGQRLEITEVSVHAKSEEERVLQGRVVCEVDVREDMLNGSGKLHGGCSMYLLDICSSLPLCALGATQGGTGHPGVSQTINIIFHSPASLNDRLKIVNTTLTMGTRVMSARCEIWNVTRDRLVASGTQTKMHSSPPKSKL